VLPGVSLLPLMGREFSVARLFERGAAAKK